MNKIIYKKEKLDFFAIILILISIIFLFLCLILPLATVFFEAFKLGFNTFFTSIVQEDSIAALKLTILITLISTPINTFFGLIIAWLISKFDFYGKTIITTILDMPFSISPVVVGLMFILLLGSNSLLGNFFAKYNIQIIYAIPGLIIATCFITFPLIAKELIPLMATQGINEEQAGLILGAKPLQVFFRITLPNIKWALIYGIILTNARAMGEFGAVSMVSGHIRGETNTLPLHIEILYNEYNFVAAFSCASILAFMALITLIIENILTRLSTKH